MVVSAVIHEVRDGRFDVAAFVTQHDPDVIVYDIGPPYRDSWALFEKLRTLPEMRDRRFVITSANARQVEQLVGRDERIYEVVDTPAELGEIAVAVKEAARARDTRTDADETTRRSNVMTMPERRQQDRRGPSWSSDDIYLKLREKREAVELERRRFGRRATDRRDGPTSHAA
jgi:CheY-like chemotaxis protein